MSRLLVVEDCQEYQKIYKKILSEEHELLILEDANKIEEKFSKFHPDLILLDIQLPGTDGLQACTILRSNQTGSEVPILFVSSRKEVSDIVVGLNLGADDYIVKPFDPMELKARINAKLRKRQGDQEPVLRSGELKIYPLRQIAEIESDSEAQNLGLTPKELKLLTYLVKHENQILSREQILNAVWGSDALDHTDRSVDTQMSALRVKCKPIRHYFESVYGQGYRFNSQAKMKS